MPSVSLEPSRYTEVDSATSADCQYQGQEEGGDSGHDGGSDGRYSFTPLKRPKSAAAARRQERLNSEA